ncbi:MAG: hypothetical protein LWX07_09630 [Bacteroidetes bacterium]|nr:hypothetical protein [Bacteroidota bacterium]
MRAIIRNIPVFLIFISAAVYLYSCDSKGGSVVNPPVSHDTNIYGTGNGKITFYRTKQIEGIVSIKVSSYTLSDTTVRQSAPPCDTAAAVSKILPAGNYKVTIEGTSFLCNYDVKVEEKICKLLNYTDCANGYVGCYPLDGTWLRTSDAPCPNCKGLKVQFSDGFGEVIYTPPGCRFPLSDIKWKNFNIGDCTVLDLARDDYGGSPEFQQANLQFFSKDSLMIKGPSGDIPYSRISYKNVKKHKNIGDAPFDSGVHTNGLQKGR